VNREAAVIVEGLEKEAKVVALREEFAVKALEDMKTRVGAKSVDVARLANLEGIAKAKRKQLEELQAAFESSAIRKDAKSQPLEAQVIQSARPSSVPHSPKKPQLAALASAATLILGLVLVVTRELVGGNRRQSQPRAAPVIAAPEPPTWEPAGPTVAAAPAMTRSAPATHEPPTPNPLTLASAAAIARRLLANGEAQSGYRSVIAGEAEGIDARDQAAEVAATLAGHGKQVVLVDWSFDGRGMSEALGLAAKPGILDLIEGRASFDDVIRRLPDEDVHIVACGSARTAGAGSLDADRTNLVLDALDEAYDHILVTGEHAAARNLFATIQGRFDVGVVVSDAVAGQDIEDDPGTFLGFEVTDIDIVHLERGGTSPVSAKRLKLARLQPASGGEARA
jgi:Mrp family chromosome partitioning ATPase